MGNTNQRILPLSNTTYDISKNSALMGLPAVGALYFGLSQIWGLPYAEEIVGSIAVINTFLGVVLTISHNSYKKSDEPYSGEIVVDTTDPEKDSIRIEYNDHPLNLVGQKEVTFKVRDESLPSH